MYVHLSEAEYERNEAEAPVGSNAGNETSDGVACDCFARKIGTAEGCHHGNMGAEITAPAHAHCCKDRNIVCIGCAGREHFRNEADCCACGTEGGNRYCDSFAGSKAEQRLQYELYLIRKIGNEPDALIGCADIARFGAAEGQHHDDGADYEHARNDAYAYLDAAAAACLYTGLATDTGFFRFSNATAHTYRAAAALLEAGAQPHVISEALEVRPLQTVRDLAEALGELELFAGGRACGIFLTQEQTARMASTESFIGHIRVIDGVDVAVVLKCKEPELCRVSMRSKHVDVSRVATLFGGGGHVRAAGCTLTQPFEEARKTIMTAIERAIREGWTT